MLNERNGEISGRQEQEREGPEQVVTNLAPMNHGST